MNSDNVRKLLELDYTLPSELETRFCGYAGLDRVPAAATVSHLPGIAPFHRILVHIERKTDRVKLRGLGYGTPRDRSVPIEVFHRHWVQRLDREPGPDEVAKRGTDLQLEFWNACRAFLGD